MRNWLVSPRFPYKSHLLPPRELLRGCLASLLLLPAERHARNSRSESTLRAQEMEKLRNGRNAHRIASGRFRRTHDSRAHARLRSFPSSLARHPTRLSKSALFAGNREVSRRFERISTDTERTGKTGGTAPTRREGISRTRSVGYFVFSFLLSPSRATPFGRRVIRKFCAPAAFDLLLRSGRVSVNGERTHALSAFCSRNVKQFFLRWNSRNSQL